MTGVLRLGKDASVSPLKNITEHDILSRGYTELYGIAGHDVNQILAILSFGEDHRQLLKNQDTPDLIFKKLSVVFAKLCADFLLIL